MGKCLLGNCQVVLAKCLADGECVENLICLQLCNGRPDETACQVISLAAGLVLITVSILGRIPVDRNRCHYFAIRKSLPSEGWYYAKVSRPECGMHFRTLASCMS